MTITRSVLALVSTAGLISCSGSDSSMSESSSVTAGTSGESVPATAGATVTSEPVVSEPDPTGATTPTPSTTEATESEAATTTATSQTPTSAVPTESTPSTGSTAAPTTSPDTADGTSSPPSDLLTPSIAVPTGEFVDAPGDLVVMRTDGDLEYWPNGVAPSAVNRAEPILLLDRADPRPEPAEGSGPNLVSDVAGLVDGAVIYADCCEPVSGNVFAIDEPGSDVGPVAVGFSADLSPDGAQLATASRMQLSVFDTSTGIGIGVLFGQEVSEGAAPRSIVDIEWIDDDTVMVLTSRDGTFRLSRYDAATLERGSNDAAIRDGAIDPVDVRFAGRTADGLVGVAANEGDRWTVEYFGSEPTSVGSDARTQVFPPTVSAIEIEPEGLGQIWVDGEVLYYLGPGVFDARPIGEDVRAAWFVEGN